MDETNAGVEENRAQAGDDTEDDGEQRGSRAPDSAAAA